MAVALEKPPAVRKADSQRVTPWHRRRVVRVSGLILATVLAIAVVLLVKYWPFTQAKIARSLQESFSGRVSFDNFHATVFPHPGAVAQNVVLRWQANSADTIPLISAKQMTIRASYADLFFRPGYISRIVLEGLRVHVPPEDSDSRPQPSTDSSGPRTRVGEVIANEAVLEIMRRHGDGPLTFDIHALKLTSVSEDKPLSFDVGMRIPLPPGEVHSHGKFGPWNEKDPGQTAASGKYSYANANLGVFEGIAGTLWSEGEFSGTLGQLQAQGKVDVPDFEVKRSKHAVPLTSRYQAVVNATNGDVLLQRVDSTILQTRVLAQGTVARKKGEHGKTTSLDFTVHQGRIQDVLRLFVKARRPPLNGATNFRAHVTVPPGPVPFLKKLVLVGDFGVEDGKFTKPETQQDITKLSETGAGKKPQPDAGKKPEQDAAKKAQEDPDGKAQKADAQKNGAQEAEAKRAEAQKADRQKADAQKADTQKADTQKTGDAQGDDVVAELAGHVELRGGTATFLEFSFTVPDAEATMHGTYNLLNEKIDLHGLLRTTAKFSNTTSGVKSVLLKPFDAVFKRKHHPGAKVPVQLTGTYEHPHAGLEIIK